MVCISLDRRADRWATFQEKAVTAGLTVDRISAVDAKTFTEPVHRHPAISVGTANNILFKTRRSHYEIDAPGAIGCSLSHFKVWAALVASGDPAWIVFEDDAPIPVDFKARLDTVVAALPTEWDVVQFQRTVYGGGVTGCKPIPDQAPWQRCTSLMGSYAYMISRRGAERLLARAYPIELHVDAYMSYMSRLGLVDMLWHPAMDIPGPEADSDIAHGAHGILNVPTHMEKHGVVAMETVSLLGLVAMGFVVGGMVSLAWRSRG
jgi:glycosyl transferase family 25